MSFSRTIDFDLSKPLHCNKISSLLLIARGYNKVDILALFEKMQSCNLGVFDRGKRGRGCVSEFIPNENCPETYSMTFEISKRGRKKRMIEIVVDYQQ